MDTGAAANDSEGSTLIGDSAPLAQVESIEEVTINRINAHMRTLVSVRECPHGFRSRLGYHANLYLTMPGAAEKEIGYIKGWRISRPSGVNPNIDPQYLMTEWYFKALGSYDRDSKEMAYCVRAIYGKGELPRRISDRIMDKEKEKELRDGGNELIFIETIYIKWREVLDDPNTEYTRYGLAGIYLETYYRLLGGKILPAWFSLNGPVTYLLLPRFRSGAPLDQCWRDMQKTEKLTDKELEEEVEQILKEIFGREDYGYERYVLNADVAGTDITVMGRAVQPEDSISESVDRLILPGAA